MNARSTEPGLPRSLLDLLLRLAPSDILLLDQNLVCRYAAPAGETFLGLPAAQLIGRPVAEILPPAANGLRPVLERAAREATPWRTRHYRFGHRTDGSEIVYHWSIHVEPVASETHRGVLVALGDVAHLIEERDHLQAENDRLREALGELQQREAEWIRGVGNVQYDVRSSLATALGYLQVLARRPSMLQGQSAQVVIQAEVLPQLQKLIGAIDRLGPLKR